MDDYMPNRRMSRGLRKQRFRGGDLTREIERRIQRKGRIRILEVGCGYGVALMELRRIYGDRVELFGITKQPEHGGLEVMKKTAAERGIPIDTGDDLPFPHIFYFDACHEWPLIDDSFDVVFSQHAFLWFEDKIKPLEEINRILTEDGIALIDLLVKRSGNADKHSIVIRDGDKEILFWNYIQEFGNIKLIYPEVSLLGRLMHWLGKKVLRIKSEKPRTYLEISKSKELLFNLELVSTTRFSGQRSKRKGQQCIYRIVGGQRLAK